MAYDNQPARTRTVTWEDPMAGARAAPSMAGIEYLRAIRDGRYPPPPIARTLGYSIDEVEDGRVTFVIEAGEHLYNPIGMVHGGVASTLLDSAMACAIHTKLPVGTAYTTVELKINFIRAITSTSGKLTCEGRIINVGRRVGLAEGTVKNAAGTLFAHGTTTCLIMPVEKKPAA